MPDPSNPPLHEVARVLELAATFYPTQSLGPARVGKEIDPMPEKDESPPSQRRAYGHDVPVIYTDDKGKSTGALVTRWHDRHPGDTGEPTADLVIVGKDGDIARVPNTPHRSRVAARQGGDDAGEHWAWADE